MDELEVIAYSHNGRSYVNIQYSGYACEIMSQI